MFLRTNYILLFMLLSSAVFAQEKADKDIRLKEVTVTERAKVANTEVAAKTRTIESKDMQSNLTRSMSELLSEVSALQVKSMGQGAMATVSIRGASSNHTQVQWNGITLNSPQTGSFDFSQIPVYFVDNVNIFYGGGEQLGASGAIGGSVNFSNGFKQVSRPVISVVSEVASNSTYSEAFNLIASHKRFTSSTRAFYQQSEGDFKFINKVYSKDWIYERRKNADYKQGGVMQEFFYTTKKGDELSAIAWWHTDNRSLPQSLLANDNTKSEKIRSNNFRSMFSYKGDRDQHHFKGTAAYLNSTSRYRLIFSDTTRTVNTSNSLILRGDYNYSGWKRVALAAALSYRFDEVSSDSYSNKGASRNTLTAQVLTTWRATRRLHLDLKTSAEMVDNKLYAYYNAGARYRFIDRYLTMKVSNSYNFRAPSMNDLYWEPGGNPDLQPEKGFSSDITLESNPQFGAFDLHFDVSYFHKNISNWIMWIPKGNGAIWEPVNFDNVKSQGAEANARAGFASGKSRHELSFNYAYTRSLNNSGRDDGAHGMQLPYMPVNRWTAGYKYNLSDKLWFYYYAQFTDARFTSADQSYQTPPYTTHNAEVGYNLKLKKGPAITFSVKADNIFDAYYESTQYYPMPLRMFWGRIILTLK